MIIDNKNYAAMKQTMNWGNIKDRIADLEEVQGGFSVAQRGIVTLSGDEKAFVKIGVDDDTKKWAKKEIHTYKFLKRQNFPFMPEFLAASPDETSFALEALTPADGWDWSNTWTEPRLQATLDAIDAVAAIAPTGSDKDFFSIKSIGEGDDGWKPLAESKTLQQALYAKLLATESDLAFNLDFVAMAKQSSSFVFNRNVLVHNDVRADNCAWNAELKTVRLVDWNWAQLGDKRIDVNALLVHVHKSGVDITSTHIDRLDADVLQWIAGFWFRSAATPIWPGGPEDLRDFQLQSALMAYKFYMLKTQT